MNTPAHVVRIDSLAAAIWPVTPRGPGFAVTLHRLDPASGKWPRIEEFDTAEDSLVAAISDAAFAWILDKTNADQLNNQEPLGLGTDPAGEGNVCLPVRHHRGQGPEGLSDASRDDDGRVRQENPGGLATSESTAECGKNNSPNVRDGKASRSASCGVSMDPAVSRLSFPQLASTSLARGGCTPDAPVGANGGDQKQRQTPQISDLGSSAICLHQMTHCHGTPLFSGVCNVYRFCETNGRLGHE